MTLSALVSDSFRCVAGQGFEPWKASADGFTVRCQGDPGVDAHSRTPPAHPSPPTRPHRMIVGRFHVGGRLWAVSADETTRNNEMRR